jgi:hypothetical protein
MPIIEISKFELGRQPCAMFRPSEKHARRCQECPDAVRWYDACRQDHHGWGWQTCHTGLGSLTTNEPGLPNDETLQEAVAAVEGVLGRAWHEQYDRVLRWFERLQRPGEIDEHRRDEYYAFFLMCYHLKDWLKSDPIVQQRVLNIGRKIEDFVNGNLSLRLCADLANGVKQFVVTKRIRIDANAGLPVRSGGVRGTGIPGGRIPGHRRSRGEGGRPEMGRGDRRGPLRRGLAEVSP